MTPFGSGCALRVDEMERRVREGPRSASPKSCSACRPLPALAARGRPRSPAAWQAACGRRGRAGHSATRARLRADIERPGNCRTDCEAAILGVDHDDVLDLVVQRGVEPQVGGAARRARRSTCFCSVLQPVSASPIPTAARPVRTRRRSGSSGALSALWLGGRVESWSVIGGSEVA